MPLAITEVNALTNLYIVPRTTDTIFKNDPLLTRLMNRRMVRFDGGQLIQRPLIYAELNGDFFLRGDTFNIAYVPTDTALQVPMKYAYVGITLYGTDDVLNRGPEAVFSQVETKMLNASLKMAKVLSTNLYKDGQSSSADVTASGGVLSTSNAFAGLLAWVDDGNSGSGYPSATSVTKSFPTVGGITRSDITATPSSGTATPTANIGGLNAYTNRAFSTFQLSEVQNAYGKAWFGNDFADLLITQQSGWDKFWQSTQPLQRYMDDKSDVAKVGFQTLRFNSSEVVISKYAPEQVLFGLNTNYLEFYVTTNPKFQFGFTGFKEAQNSVDVSGQFLFSGNLIVPNPRTCFKLIGSALA